MLVDQKPMDRSVQNQLVEKQLRFTLAGLIRITETMLDLAEKKEWDAVELLEKGRRKELAILDGMALSQAESDDIGEAYVALLSINDRITSLIENEKALLVESFSTIKGKSTVAKIYQST